MDNTTFKSFIDTYDPKNNGHVKWLNELVLLKEKLEENKIIMGDYCNHLNSNPLFIRFSYNRENLNQMLFEYIVYWLTFKQHKHDHSL